MTTTPDVIALFILLLLFLASGKCAAADEAVGLGWNWEMWWTYDGISGPEFWGVINPAWAMCSEGRRQSPINLDPRTLLHDPNLTPITLDKTQVHGQLVNTGHSLEWRVRSSGPTVNLSGGPLSYVYTVSHLRLHFGERDLQGSEHTVANYAFPAEHCLALSPSVAIVPRNEGDSSRGFRRRGADLTQCGRRRGTVSARRPYWTLAASRAPSTPRTDNTTTLARHSCPPASPSAESVKDKSKMCSLKAIISCGIILAAMDIIQGLTTLGWYGYRFVSYYFYLCPRELPIDECHAEKYHYEQLYTLRTYIGIGEGAVTPIFAAIYIVALVRHKPWLAWCWLIKAFGALGINVYFLSQWLIRLKNFDHLRTIRPAYDQQFLWIGIALTLA
ncbi:uncharacterized protein LOC125040486 [Penaeus chinensis]|uniref:uncharacterized protein LOC125040486 n=1 Tax=Penaeus chinensis TaxID=139456 RepID=UPI001FB656C9|nr:uncharacterized protein LOC125040486 [Penaeus chinensis]